MAETEAFLGRLVLLEGTDAMHGLYRFSALGRWRGEGGAEGETDEEVIDVARGSFGGAVGCSCGMLFCLLQQTFVGM